MHLPPFDVLKSKSVLQLYVLHIDVLKIILQFYVLKSVLQLYFLHVAVLKIILQLCTQKLTAVVCTQKRTTFVLPLVTSSHVLRHTINELH